MKQLFKEDSTETFFGLMMGNNCLMKQLFKEDSTETTTFTVPPIWE